VATAAIRANATITSNERRSEIDVGTEGSPSQSDG
jgi:hypothetical protein